MKKLNIYTLLAAFLFSFSINAQSLMLDTKPDKVVQEGEVFSVDVSAEDFNEVISCQFAVFWDPAVLQYIAVNNYNLPGIVDTSDVNDNINEMYAHQGKIRFNWYDPDPNFAGYSLDDGAPVFTIHFKAIGEPAWKSMIEVATDEAHPMFPIEFVNKDGIALDVEIDPGCVTIDGVNASRETITQDFTLFQNSPNPFTTETNISFSLNQYSDAQLSIHNHAGKVVFEKSADFTAGLHTIQVNRDLFSAAGSYFFTLKTENATATRQLVVQ